MVQIVPNNIPSIIRKQQQQDKNEDDISIHRKNYNGNIQKNNRPISFSRLYYRSSDFSKSEGTKGHSVLTFFVAKCNFTFIIVVINKYSSDTLF